MSISAIPEPPHNPEDTQPTGIQPRGASRGVSRTAQVGVSVLATLITAVAALLYVQQGNAPVPTQVPPTVIILTAAATATIPPSPTALPTKAQPMNTSADQ